MAKKTLAYDAKSIVALEQADGVRDNPSMYLEDGGEVGTFQMAKEIIDNASDEVGELQGDRQVLVVIDGEKITVADNGRGIPVERHSVTKLSALETVMTRLHAGAKGRGKAAYGKRTIGVHGVGAAVVNALCTRMRVSTKRDGKWWRQEYAKGRATTKVVAGRPPLPGWPKGTVVEYERDASVMPSPLSPQRVLDYVALQAHFRETTTVVRVGAKRERKFPPRPMSELLRGIEHKMCVPALTIRTPDVRCVIAWRTMPESVVTTYVNGSPTAGRGTHAQGLDEGVADAFAKVFGAKTADEDVTIGMHAVLDVSVDRPKFQGQAKTRLVSPETRAIVRAAVSEALARHLRANREAATESLAHARDVGKALRDGKDRVKLASLTREKSSGKSNLPIKLMASAPGTRPDERELYLLEGDSAAGTAKDAKLSYQEVLPLRGKLPNLIKDGRKALSNQEVLDIVTSCGYNSKRPDEHPRVSKLILLADADVDGDHVAVLMLTMIYKQMPEFFRDGRVYLSLAPMFQSTVRGGKYVYGDSVEELRKAGAAGKVKRVKGWGGCPVPQLRELAFDASSRRLLRVTQPMLEERTPFELLMGKKPEARCRLVGVGESSAEGGDDDE